MDEIDMAQVHQANELRWLLSAHAYALPSGEAASECEECEEPIPVKRRKAAPGCTRCLGCQERHERRLRGER